MFETFWQAYPRRIGKGAAKKAFEKAIQKTDLETMLEAIEAYKRNKPDYCDYCHPSTWLNQERWEDEWEEPKTMREGSADEVKAWLRSRGLDEVADKGPDHPAWSWYVPIDFNVVELRRA